MNNRRHIGISKRASAAATLLQLGTGGIVGGLGGMAYGGYNTYKLRNKGVDNINALYDAGDQLAQKYFGPFDSDQMKANRAANRQKSLEDWDNKVKSEVLPEALKETGAVGAGIGIASVGAAQVLASLIDKLKAKG